MGGADAAFGSRPIYRAGLDFALRSLMSRGSITRQGTHPGRFRYIAADGRTVRDRSTLDRIASLVIPPAWRDVHIAPNARAAVQAWGYDARGRKQYRYHGRAIARGELRKHYRVRALARDLPRIRERLARDGRHRLLDRERVAANVVRLIGHAFFRVGSERYARENRTFGLTTLRKSHVRVEGDRAVFTYRGKRAIRQRQIVYDPVLVRFVQALLATPGPRLFRFLRDGDWVDLTARDVNDYLRSLAGARYTAKDFRTWGGTLRVATVLADLGPASNEREAARNVVTAVRCVAAELGNTPTICRKSYVHPIVLARYLDDGATIADFATALAAYGDSPSSEELALIAFLDEYFPDRRRRPRREDGEAVAA
ncbi:MAG: DNA topoisomerase IB [Gemmatimonadaceae bacterium]